jgi:hypothetical protein
MKWKQWWPEIITNQELFERTEQSDINVENKRGKYGWIGHTLRKSQNEICHTALEWNPQEGYRRDAPKPPGGALYWRKPRGPKLKTDCLCSTGVWL